MSPTLEGRVAVHAALADPTRLAIVDALVISDRSPSELSRRFGVPGNLLAHHLVVLERAGLVRRFASSADRRRRYVQLVQDAARGFAAATALPESVLFVCTRNSARSQLAAAMWKTRTGRRAASAGTDPAEAVHPGAFAAAERAGLQLGPQHPRRLADAEPADVVVTVCDRAHEDVGGVDASWWHWSVADPASIGSPEAFDATIADLDRRVTAVVAATSRP